MKSAFFLSQNIVTKQNERFHQLFIIEEQAGSFTYLYGSDARRASDSADGSRAGAGLLQHALQVKVETFREHFRLSRKLQRYDYVRVARKIANQAERSGVRVSNQILLECQEDNSKELIEKQSFY